MVPLRFIAEGVGARVGWDGTERKVTIESEGKLIELWIGKKTARVNGETYIMDVAPEIHNGRTFVPIRFVAENLGLKVGWDQNTKMVILSKEIVMIDELSDADDDRVVFKDEKEIGTDPNNPNTVYDTLSDYDLYNLIDEYPGLNIFKKHPDGKTGLTLPEKVKWGLDPRTPYNLDQIVDDEIVIKYALSKGAQPKKEEVIKVWNEFNEKYKEISGVLKNNLNEETISVIDKVGDEVVKFKQLELDKLLSTVVDKEFIERTIKWWDEYDGIAPILAVYSEEFIQQTKAYFEELKKTNLEFIAEMLKKYPTLSLYKQADTKVEYPQLDFSKRETFENPDGKSGLSLEDKINLGINPLNPHNFDQILNDGKAVEYGRFKGKNTKEGIKQAIENIEENFGSKLSKALKINFEENVIKAEELEQQGNTAEQQVREMWDNRQYKKKPDKTTMRLEDLTSVERYKTLIFLNKTQGVEDINILLSQSGTLGEAINQGNIKEFEGLIHVLYKASNEIETPAGKKIKELRVFKKFINQWGLFNNNAGEYAVKIWVEADEKLKEEIRGHPKLFLSYIGKNRAWAEAGKVKIGRKEYDFREVFEDIVKYTIDQMGYVTEKEKYLGEKGYELFEFSGYGAGIENLPFIWMQGSPFTPGLSHINLIKKKLMRGEITLKEAIEDMMTTEGAEEILRIAEERYHQVPIGKRGCVSDFLGPGVGPKEYGSKPATKAMWVDVKVRGPPKRWSSTQWIPEAHQPYGQITSEREVHIYITRKETIQKLIDLLQKTNPPEEERIPHYTTGDAMTVEKIIDDALLNFTIEYKWKEDFSEQSVLKEINGELRIPGISIINRNILLNKDWNSFKANKEILVEYVTPYEVNPIKPFDLLIKKNIFSRGEFKFSSLKDLY